MTLEADLSAAALLREHALDLKGAYERARFSSGRWQELDTLYRRRSAELVRAATAEKAGDILRTAAAEIESIVAADIAEREAERRKPNIAFQARLFEQRRMMQIAFARRVSAGTVTAVNLLQRQLVAANERLGAVADEAELRDALSDIADGLKSMQATIAVEGRASVEREAAAAKSAA